MTRKRAQRVKRREALVAKPELADGQQVMCVVHCRGQNLYDARDASGVTRTFELPKRLRHIAFIRPGCFVFTRVDVTRRDGVVKGDIEAIVLDSFLPTLRKARYWPAAFLHPVDAAGGMQASVAQVQTSGAPSQASEAPVQADGASVRASESPAQAPTVAAAVAAAATQSSAVQKTEFIDENSSSEEEQDEDDDEIFGMGGNPNRASWTYFQESSDEEEAAISNK